MTVITRHRANTRMYSTHWHAINACQVHQLPICVALCCRSSKTRMPIKSRPSSAQLGGTPYHSPSYIRVNAVVWACSHRQTDRHTNVREQYTFSVIYDSCGVSERSWFFALKWYFYIRLHLNPQQVFSRCVSQFSLGFLPLAIVAQVFVGWMPFLSPSNSVKMLKETFVFIFLLPSLF